MNFQSGINLSAPMAANLEMEYLLNLIPENGSMKNIPQPQHLDINLQQGERLLCVHHINYGGSQARHFIVASENTLAFYDQDNQRTAIATLDSDINGATTLGNLIMLVSKDEPMAYVIWKDGQYRFIGNQFPEISLQFMLNSTYEQAFAEGSTTGIILEAGPSSSQYDYSEIISPTPMEITINADDNIEITPQLDSDTSYSLKIRTTDGRDTKVAIAVYAVINQTTERYLGSGRSRNPEVRFMTPSTLDFSKIRVKIKEATYNRQVTLLLMKGSTASTGFYFKNTEENFNALMAVANKFIMQYATERNRFMFPFFVRYALRLYDGSYVCPSAPCLMMPSTDIAPQIWTAGGTSGGTWDTYTAAVVSELKFRLSTSVTLDAWEGIIDGIAIAVSSPIYSYDMAVEWSQGNSLIRVEKPAQDDNDGYTYSTIDDISGGFSTQWLFNRNNNLVDNPLNICLPETDKARQVEDLRAKGIFYVVGDLEISQLPQPGSWTPVNMEEHTLETLECRKRLDDNTISLSSFRPTIATIYNSRLVIGNVTENKFKGYKPGLMTGIAGNRRDETSIAQTLEVKAIVKLTEGGNNYQICEVDSTTRNSAPLFWFFYPSTAAKEVVIWRKLYPNLYQRAKLILQPHTTLDGAFWFDNFNEPQWSELKTYELLTSSERQELETESGGADITRHNQILQSQVNNPFLFSADRVNVVGDGVVYVLCAAVKALSQGQFGQFPLYAFTSEGIWALEVGADGEFMSKQPVARDPAENSHAVVPTDNAVVFATTQGLKIIQGAQVVRISEALEGKQADVIALLGGINPQFEQLLSNLHDDFNSGVGQCQLAYDYPNNAIHIYHPQQSHAHLIYSLKNGQFAMVQQNQNPIAIVNDWTDTIIQQGQELLKYSRIRQSQPRKGIILTRPIPIIDGIQMNRLHELRLLWTQHHEDSSAKTLVLASNDKYHWWPISSINSHSYRWIRIAIYTNINDQESIDQIITS